MAVIGTYESSGLELPIFGRDTDVAEKGRIPEAIARSIGSTFVRGIATAELSKAHPEDRLGLLLQTADNEFEEIARHCQAEVIPHEWGLWDPGDKKRSYVAYEASYKLHLPPRLIVVAKVNIVRNGQEINASSEQGRQIVEGVEAYKSTNPAVIPYDTDWSSFIDGRTDSDSSHKRYLVDIEPRLRKPNT
jgi:hypothetical protein